MESYNSISKILDKFLKLHGDTLNILNAITKSIVSNEKEVTFTSYVDNKLFTYTIPSFKFLNDKIENLENVVESFVSNSDNKPIIFDNKPLPAIKIDKIDLSNEYIESAFYKNNYFFENLYNPLLYIKLDFDEITKNTNIKDSTNKVLVKRVIVKQSDLNTDEQKLRLSNYNKSKIDYNEIISFLNTYPTIKYFEDDEIKDLTPILIQNENEYLVKQVLTHDIINNILYEKVILDNIEKLNQQDVKVVLNNNTLYKVDSIEKTNNQDVVKLLKLQGISNVGINDKLYLVNDISKNKELEISIGVDEFCFIFIKPIDPINNVISKDFGNGIFIDTNTLLINSNNKQYTLKDFYLNSVDDFSNILNKINQVSNVKNSDIDISNINPGEIKFEILNSTSHISNTSEGLLKTLEDLIIQYKNKSTSINIDGLDWYQQQQLQIEIKSIAQNIADSSILINKEREKIISPKFKVKCILDLDKVENNEIIKYKIGYRYKSIDSISQTTWNIIETYEREIIDGNYESINELNPLNIVYLPISPGEKIEVKFKKIINNYKATDWSEIYEIKIEDNLLSNEQNAFIQRLDSALFEANFIKLRQEITDRFISVNNDILDLKIRVGKLEA